jgi:serine/threonine-protein kinase
LIGNTLGNYRITQKIGQGGVGEVWRAVDLTLDREVALKLLRPELAAQEGVVARFRTEALALARLNHPHVATIHGFQTDGGTPTIVMEYIPGQTLHAIVRSFGPVQSARAVPLFLQVLDAIQHAHDHGIVHRDLKASNVMMNHQGSVKMLDFGIARVVGSVHLTQGPSSFGTPSWMAPEQVRGEEADVRTDVYALGLLLYWLVAARLPFEGDNQFELQRAHVETAPPSPREFVPDLPDTIEKTILRALAKQREERFASAAAMSLALREGFVPAVTVPLPSRAIDHEVTQALGRVDDPPEFLVAAPTIEIQPVAAEPREATPERRRRVGWIPIALTALLVALAVAALLRSPREPATPPAATTAPVVVEAPAVPAPEPAPIKTAKPAPAGPTRAPKPKHKAAPAESQGDEGWVIKR